jgi:signal transduction histidine kinase
VRYLAIPVDWLRASLARKLVAVFILLYGLLVALLIWQFVAQETAALTQQRLHRAEGVASMLAASGAPWVVSEDRAGLQELTSAATSMKGQRYSLFLDANGRVLAHSDPQLVGKKVVDPAARALLAGAPAPRIVASTDDAIDAAAPVMLDGRLIGWAWASVRMDEVRAEIHDVLLRAVAFGCVAAFIGLAIGLAIAHGVTRRIEALAHVSDRFRKGERGVRAAVRGIDEVAAAARGLNGMLEAVSQTERSLTEAQAFAGLGSFTFEPGSRFLTCSAEMPALLGLDTDGKPPTVRQLLRALPTDQRIELLALVRDPKHIVSSRTMTVRRRDGSERVCWVQMRSERRARATIAILGIVQDVTEREAAAAQLRQAQKMEAVGQLTGGLAHDFNNLLAVAIGNLDIANEQLAVNTLAKEAVEEALEAILRGSSLTRQLLAFSRRQPLTSKSVDINALVAEFEPLWRRTVGGNVAVLTRLAPHVRPTKADPSQLESALLNLVINARDAMPQGGTVTIETEHAEIEQSMADGLFDDIPAGRYSVVTVSDTGHGMTPEVRERACEPFFTTKSVGAGTGLGLSMIYGFVKQSGGHLKMYSEVGRGTAIRLYLPVASGPADATRTNFLEEAMPLADGETILVVEDDEDVRRLVQRQLRELGYMVLSATDGRDALRRIEEQRIDLLFTDIVMPGGMSGIELGALAARARPGLRILYTSGFTRAGPTELSNEAHLLTKPYRKRDLALRVRELLDAAGLELAGAES